MTLSFADQREAAQAAQRAVSGDAQQEVHASEAQALQEIPHETYINDVYVTKLFRAAGQQDVELVRALVARIGSTDVLDKRKRTPLCVASAQGAISTMQLLLEGLPPATKYGKPIKGANTAHCDVDGATPLHFACAGGHESAAAELIRRGAPVDVCDNAGKTPLTYACESLSKSCVTLLLNNGAAVNAVRADAVAPILALVAVDLSAAEKTYGDSQTVAQVANEVLTKLLESGAKPNVADDDGNTPLHVATSNSRPHFVKTLTRTEGVALAPFNYNGQTPLHIAAFLGDRIVATLLVDSVTRGTPEISMAAPAKKPGQKSRREGVPVPVPGAGITPLHCACLGGREEIAKVLLHAGARAGAEDASGRSPLYYAAFCGHADLVKLMLTRQQNAVAPTQIDGADMGGRSALHAAAFMARDEVVHLLADQNADLSQADAEGRTALHLAAAAGNASTCEAMLEHPRASACHLSTVTDDDGRIASHLAAAQGHAETLEAILDFGAPADAPTNPLATTTSKAGWTPLHAAAHAGASECVAVLLSRNADPAAVDAEGRTPLHLAVYSGVAESVALIIEALTEPRKGGRRSSTPDQRRKSVVAAASATASGTPLEAMESGEGFTALHVASQFGQIACAKLLIDAGANVNAVTSKHQSTPLHLAALHGQAQMALFLAQSGGAVSLADYAGRTALHCAAYFGHTLCGLALVRMGGSLAAKDNGGNTPVTAAVLGGYRELARALEEESRRPDAEGVSRQGQGQS